MKISKIFFERYDPLHKVYIEGFWELVPHDLMRQQPHPRLNSIAWILWHMTRAEDAGVNRFVVDRAQVLDEGGWMERMKIAWRHHGSEMPLEELAEFNRTIDLDALHGYTLAVEARTRKIVPNLTTGDLEPVMEQDRLRQLLVEEGLAHSQAEGFIRNYLGWSRSKCLMTFALTHPFQHIGEIEVIATLLGIDFG